MGRKYYYGRTRFTEKPLRPYVAAIGQTALAWNDLHEHLGRFFGHFMRGASREAGLAIWQSSRVDRSKRQLLEAAVKTAPKELTSGHPKFKDDLLWLLARVEALEDTRNNVVHAPLHLEFDSDDLAPPIAQYKKGDFISVASVLPMDFGNNTRAKNLIGKNLLSEYRWCRDSLVKLRVFLRAIDESVDSGKTWPRRPKLPIRGVPKRDQRGPRSDTK